MMMYIVRYQDSQSFAILRGALHTPSFLSTQPPHGNEDGNSHARGQDQISCHFHVFNGNNRQG